MSGLRNLVTWRLAVVALLIAASITVVLVLTGGSTRKVVATFEKVNGLVEGGKVTLAGVRVGTVERIVLDEDGLPRVTMSVDEGVQLREPVRADLRMRSLSGTTNRFVNITSGHGAVVTGDLGIPRTLTGQPIEIDEVLSTLDAPARRDLDKLLAGWKHSFAGRGRELGEALQHGGPGFGAIAAMVEQATRDREALQGLVSDSERVTRVLARDPQSSASSVEGLARLLAATAARQTELRAAVHQLAPGLRSGRAALDRVTTAVPTLRAVVRDTRPVARALPAFSKRLSRALTVAPPALAELRGLVREAPPALARLTPLVREATPFIGRVAAVARQANPMLDPFRAAFPDFLNFFSNWADFTANYDAAGHGGRVAIVPAPISDTPRDPDEDGAGLLMPPFTRTPGVMEGEPWRDYKESFVGSGR